MKKGLIALFMFAAVSKLSAQQYNSAEIYSDIQKLKVLGSVLYIAAHPDDENTRLLAFLAQERQYRTGYLSLTRGDGGQNLIGDEQGIDLGLIRTQELLAARKVDGAEQFFTRAFDFGFSKSTTEALKKWNEEKILADAVWVIRNFQPDIIITRFPEDDRAGHGHHSASAVIAHRAFIAAADSTKFPEQFKFGVKPWKTRRLFWNTFNFGGNNTTSPDQLKVDVGGYNPVLGLSYGEIAATSRSQHKSQGFGVPASRGASYEFFTQWEGDKAGSDPMEGIDVSWKKAGNAFEPSIDVILKEYSLFNPAASLKSLVALKKQFNNLPDSYWKKRKVLELDRIIERASGLFLDATTNNEYAIQGDSVRVNLVAINRSGANVRLKNIGLSTFDSSINRSLTNNTSYTLQQVFPVPDSMPVSHPYWMIERMEDASFVVNNQELIGKPWNDPAMSVSFVVEIEGEELQIRKPVQYKYTDPVKGELYQPITVVPAVTLTTDPSILVFRKTEKQKKEMLVNLHANKEIKGYNANVYARMGSKQYENKDAALDLNAGSAKDYLFTISNADMLKNEQLQLQAYSELKNGKELQPAYLTTTSIKYDHIPNIHYFYPDAVKLLNIDLKTAGKKIGYIEGAGDRVPIALQQMGYEVTFLKEKDITSTYLAHFDAIITGVRAYNVHSFLQARYSILMDYVEKGGNLIVQYNTNNQLGGIKSRIGPYPFNISRGRITDENSPVEMVIKDHPVLNYPNKIVQKDFEGWIQERGIYFADQPDPRYQSPLKMNDPDENSLGGSLLVGDYGKGTFVYTGLVFFRQLPAGVPGAYRLLANIIALNRKAAF
ncbi:MAG: PIG-L family deacetylase [Flavitalea sp.]